ncbi:casein kinase II subunit beta-1-like isoform X2 [Zingiber officinale]|uniref:casein kinase II subunit beta-1-like isoform X2 n=1 Tax=Zingiber officinale TaxID=94328 RepID=UPI001C4D8085|nr:casein kinase II subunit beta-1-like isoform X2 [Zingiber officinale]
MLKTGSNARDRSGAANANPNPKTSAAFEPNSKASSKIPLPISGSKKRLDSTSTSALPSKEAHFNDKPTLGSEETDLSTSEGEDSSWITWFCGLRDMILDNDSLSGDIDSEEHSEIESAAEQLYGLIHARYIVTSRGLNAMHEKYKKADFGCCPRFFCEGQPCLPVGTSDIPHNGSVKIYCPKCEDIYLPRCKYQSNIDGACIGTTFPHLFLMTFPSAKPSAAVQQYVPKVFGFKLHKDST